MKDSALDWLLALWFVLIFGAFLSSALILFQF